ncbi:retrovirus-related pol polyprotein from transposon TNT 1-94 [Tanacetum coccineum]
MDLCGPMRVQTINGKKYILVIVDDYSRFTWVKFLRSKDETPTVVIKFLKQIQVGLNKTVRFIRTDNGTEFVNKTLYDYYESVGIFHQKTVPRTPQQNGVVERRNRTLVEAARTMLIFSKAPMFLWAEAVATACYTQNRSLIHTRHDKTPYELVHNKKPDLTFFWVFGALCYPTNDSENLGKLQPRADIGIFIGYAPSRKGYRIYNKRTRQIMETIHVQFDELTEQMAPVQSSPGPTPNLMTVLPGLKLTPGYISSGLVQNLVSSTPYVPPSKKDYEILFQPLFDEYFNPPPRAVSLDPVAVAAQELLIQSVQLRQLPLIKMYHLLVLHQQIRKFNLKSFFKIFGLYTSSLLNAACLSEGSGITPEDPDEPKDNSAVVAEKQARYVQTNLTLSSAKLEIQSMVDVPIHQEDLAVQRTPLIDPVISMVTENTASPPTPPTTQAHVQMCSNSCWKDISKGV